ncbi:MAG: hypothetical protein ACO34E_11905, partial [Limisphaerales bacterium]
PKAPKLEQWSPGIPGERILFNQNAWTWSGNWTSESGWKSTSQPNLEATLSFTGIAVAVLGRLDQKGGRAEVYLDGKKQKLGIDAYIVPNTHDNVLWQAYDLKPGKHTLRIVTLNSADSRSAGHEIAISQAVTYIPAR